MIKINYNWDSDKYNKFVQYLKNIGDIKTKEFNDRIFKTNYENIGIKTPVLKSIANDISKKDPLGFLEFCGSNYYEEVMVEGLVIGKINDENTFAEYFMKYINKIDCWALCDGFVANAKIMKKSDFSDLAYSLILDTREYYIRVGYVMLLNYYVDDEHIDTILSLCEKESNYFYVNMAISWLISVCFIKYRDKTLNLLKQKKLSTFVQNKAISKINDSFRVTSDDKELVKTFKK